MDKYIVKKRFPISHLLSHLLQKFLQRPGYYPIRHFERMRRDRSPWLTH